MAAALPAFRVLETSQVSPPPGSVAEASLPITFLEIFWLYADPVERVFFYRLPCSTSSFLDSVLPGLKSSLSLALRHFYPLAGKIRVSPGINSDDDVYRYELHYADGDSVSFTVAEYDADFDSLCGSHALDVAELLPLVPELPSSDDDDAARPVMALQATVLPGRGVAIGITVHHSACDGSSSMHFMASWAAAFRSGGSPPVVPPPLVIDKSLVADPRGLYSIYMTLVTKLRSDLLHTTQDNAAGDVKLCETFVLSQYQIKRLKELVQAKSEDGKTASIHCSTIVVVYAYVWTCLARAKGFDGNRIAHLVFAADCRRRMSPPLPAGYFGSCVGPCFVEAKAGDITDDDGGFLVACEATGRTIEGFKRGAFDGAETWLERMLVVAPEQPMSVAGSPNLKVYSTDFGWGRPEKVVVTSIRNTGAISLAENRDEEEGGVEIGLVLPKDELIAFGAHFSGGLKALLG